eukprot:scaffold24105_cov113-Isochrysis_galbana.AAC.6
MVRARGCAGKPATHRSRSSSARPRFGTRSSSHGPPRHSITPSTWSTSTRPGWCSRARGSPFSRPSTTLARRGMCTSAFGCTTRAYGSSCFSTRSFTPSCTPTTASPPPGISSRPSRSSPRCRSASSWAASCWSGTTSTSPASTRTKGRYGGHKSRTQRHSTPAEQTQRDRAPAEPGRGAVRARAAGAFGGRRLEARPGKGAGGLGSNAPENLSLNPLFPRSCSAGLSTMHTSARSSCSSATFSTRTTWQRRNRPRRASSSRPRAGSRVQGGRHGGGTFAWRWIVDVLTPYSSMSSHLSPLDLLLAI